MIPQEKSSESPEIPTSATPPSTCSSKAAVPILANARYKAWPKNSKGGRAQYSPLAEALSRSHATDAHFACYSVPAVERRLNREAPERLPDGVPMVAAVFDVDCEAAHAASGGKGDTPAPDEWWLGELDKLNALAAAHPGAFVYRTRGGYRIVFVL